MQESPSLVNGASLEEVDEKLKLDTKYYNPEIHLASSALPNILK